MLRAIPQGAVCFIDANIVYYHIFDTPPLSEECSDFLYRVEQGELTRVISSDILADAVHKVMMTELVALHGIPRAGILARVKKHPELLDSLNLHKAIPPIIRGLNVIVEPITLELLEAATELSVQYRLLTNDALILTTMKKFGIEHLATNDNDFDNISDIQVWKPR
ncbi:MAG: type II toxin-antitoxin system VapC family toxin [Acidobacteriota bacterium]